MICRICNRAVAQEQALKVPGEDKWIHNSSDKCVDSLVREVARLTRNLEISETDNTNAFKRIRELESQQVDKTPGA